MHSYCCRGLFLGASWPEVHQSTIGEMLLRSSMVDGHLSGKPVVMNSPDQ
ncbi:hypothetical protein Esi_0313_0014 [Ectocarpus siliculosus]|uniref:Uncharacterized protein n=1 Tax=Ectocarpus siliculosus TaxID=2880 RepID=D7FWU1_ECTSI|nr:hypothetical protein Esi_0313_0014 [Ectocarpus siliculosus]|eukprot:CBJ32179.1 hypothetical protein Esi_0313_0014 [Ectocarpus siliculosus]